MLLRRWSAVVLGVLGGLMLAASPARAAAPGWYYGLGGGEARADLVTADLDDFADFVLSTAGTPLTRSVTIGDSDTVWSLYFGYQWSPYFAAEAGYVDLGAYPYRQTGTIDLGNPAPDASSFGFEVSSKGYPVSLLAMLPAGPWFDLHARVGLLLADTDARLTATAGAAGLDQPFTGNSEDFFYGAGAAMNLGDVWSLRVDWIRYQKVGSEEDTTETDLDAVTLSILYRFGTL